MCIYFYLKYKSCENLDIGLIDFVLALGPHIDRKIINTDHIFLKPFEGSVHFETVLSDSNLTSNGLRPQYHVERVTIIIPFLYLVSKICK